MVSTEAQKRAQQKWRERNREKYNEFQKKLANEYYHKNSEKVLEYKKKKYMIEKECQKFRNILILENDENIDN